MGGDGGMIAYKKNIITSSDGVGGMGWITQIDFRHSMSGSSSPGLYVRYNQSLGNEITAFLGDMSNGQDHRQDYWEFALNGETDSDLFVYGRTEGGLATSVLTAGSGGTYGSGEQTTSTASTMQGGEGGDGRLGTQGPDYNTGIRASETIPIQSVFGGIGTGGLSYFTSTTNCKASGGGGYGEANPNGSAGYGAGGTCFKIGSGTNDYNEGAGIVCIYYHNNPI